MVKPNVTLQRVTKKVLCLSIASVLPGKGSQNQVTTTLP